MIVLATDGLVTIAALAQAKRHAWRILVLPNWTAFRVSVWQSLGLTLFCHGFLEQVCVQLCCGVALCQATVFILQLTPLGYESSIQTVVFAAPLIEGCRADVVLKAQLSNGDGGLGLFDNGDDLCIAETGCFHENILYRVARKFHF